MSLVTVAVLAVSLTSCSFAERYWAQKDLPNASHAAFQRVVEALNAGDADALKEEFSAAAQDEDPNFDNEIVRLFEMLPDGVWSWRSDGYWSGGRVSSGEAYFDSHCTYAIVLDSPTPVYIAFNYIVYNTIDPGNVGIYSMTVFAEGDGIPAEEAPGLFVSDSPPIVGGRP